MLSFALVWCFALFVCLHKDCYFGYLKKEVYRKGQQGNALDEDGQDGDKLRDLLFLVSLEVLQRVSIV